MYSAIHHFQCSADDELQNNIMSLINRDNDDGGYLCRDEHI